MLRLIGLAAALFMLSGGVNAQSCRGLQGAWRFVSGEYLREPGEVSRLDEEGRSALKVLSEGHFSYIALEGDGSFHGAHGGKWVADGTTYSETMDYAFVPSMKGKEYVYRCRVEGDHWYLEGELEDLGLAFQEVWRRVD